MLQQKRKAERQIRKGQDNIKQTPEQKDKEKLVSIRRKTILLYQAEQSTAASRIRNFQQDQSEDTVKKEENQVSWKEKKDTHRKTQKEGFI